MDVMQEKLQAQFKEMGGPNSQAKTAWVKEVVPPLTNHALADLNIPCVAICVACRFFIDLISNAYLYL